MSYVLAVVVPEGLVALADTRVTVATEKRYDEKIWLDPDQRFLALFAGNRFWTDEVLRALASQAAWKECATVCAFADWMGRQLVEIKTRRHDLLEDANSGLEFDIGLIVGGQGPADAAQDIRFVYQAGNHVSYSDFTPYHFAGMTAYGKFILDDGVFYRDFRNQGFADTSTLRQAIAAALLSMHAVQSSVTTVDYPLHLLVWPRGGEPQRFFYQQSALREFRRSWRHHLDVFLKQVPLPTGSDEIETN